MKSNIEIFLRNILAMYMEITKAYDDMIGLRQLLYMCKAEKPHLNDRVEMKGLCVFAVFEGELNLLIKLKTVRMEPIRKKDNGHNYDFTGVPLIM